MYTKSDFLRVIESLVDNEHDVAIRYRAQDPRIVQALQAIATVSSMLSEQVEMAGMEWAERSRDTTILADAALKGILPSASPCIARIAITNSNNSAITVNAGRTLLDAIGRSWDVIENATVAAGESSIVKAVQNTIRIISHVFTESSPFARIEIPEPPAGQFIAGVHVTDMGGTPFEFRERFTNTSPDERVYHVLTDEYRRLYVEFGYGGVAGYQPQAGESINIQVTDTYGAISPQLGSPFVFEYANAIEDSRIKMAMQAIEAAGIDPPDMQTLRELTAYPSIYDDNAVFHGEFDRLIRKSIQCEFLSVWNEQVEEDVRGASVDNINTMFVSVASDSAAIADEIKRIVRGADDSYRFRFIEPTDAVISIVVTGSVARVYPIEQVKGQIITLLLGAYGKGSPLSKRGMTVPTHEEIRRLLRKGIQALQDDNADYNVEISYALPVMPEHWHYATAESISVTIQESNYALNRWGR